MLHNVEFSLKNIGMSEGGYVNHPKDPGGATDRGITQRTYDAWNRAHGKSLRSVRGISKNEADAILVDQYFRPVRFNELADGLDYAMGDYSTNSGPAQANKDLQRALRFSGRDVDGVFGLMTLAAARERDTVELIQELCQRRMSFLRGLRTFKTFGKGWTTRVMGNRDGYQAGDVGVIDRAVDLALKRARNDYVVTPEGAPKAAPDADFPARPATLPLLVIGAKGDAVRYAQAHLERHGFAVDIDGDYGPKTERQTRAFQRARKLSDDGKIGAKSWKELEK